MKLALTFSGGGYRAAGFSLGTLSYLYLVPYSGQMLGDQIMLLSTVSGGTITGTRYALGLQRGEAFPDSFRAIYDFLANTELVREALGNLGDNKRWQNGRLRSLINSFADVYDQHLFENALFGELMAPDSQRQLKHLSFNATEFANGLQFRFQWSEKMVDPGPGEPERGLTGNLRYPLPEAVAARLRLGDILAASSCFPAGFEPINFPGDFLPGVGREDWAKGMSLPVGLMDGGIVDNQGIAPVLLAETRMQRNKAAVQAGTELEPVSGPEIDLLLVSDVASPDMKPYQFSRENKKGWLRRRNLLFYVVADTLLAAAAVGGMFLSYRDDDKGWMIGSTAVAVLCSTFFLLLWGVGRLPRQLKVPGEFLRPLGVLLHLPVYVYESLIMNRLNSFKMLTLNVFLKHVRAMNYDTIYQDPKWKNRRIMCAVYELKKEKIDERAGTVRALPPELMPSQDLMRLADKASSFGTTLWFTEEDTRSRMLNALVACGQATACWNLLEYIHKLKVDASNTNEAHRQLLAIGATVQVHWAALKEDPYALLRRYDIQDSWVSPQKDSIGAAKPV